MKLISDADFGINCKTKEKEFSRRIDYLDWYEKTRDNYSNFLNQPLKKSMFVPCDENDNVLEYLSKPKLWQDYLEAPECLDGYFGVDDCYKYENYLKAKENVIFEGFYLNETYKREKSQLPYLTNGKVSVFLHSDFAIRHQLIEDLVGSDLDINKQF